VRLTALVSFLLGGSEMIHSLRIASIALVASLAMACAGPRLADGIDLELDLNPLDGPSDLLHSPYVAGADFGVWSIHADEEDEVGWTIGTSDPSVIRIREQVGDGHARASADAPGDVDLMILDAEGEEIHRTAVEVVQPDHAELIAHGPRIVRRPELQPESTGELQVLVGGSGTFLVEWYAGNDRLFGHGALTASSGPGVAVEPRQTHLFEDREWVTFTALEPGRHEVELLANGELTRTITIVAVEEAAIDHVELHGQNEGEAEQGEPLVVYAQAYDADGTPIYGVEYQWDVDGAREEGLGDLYRYEFSPGMLRELCARHGAHESFAMIQSAGGFVDSTNRIGCSVGPVGATGGLPLAGLALIGFAFARRWRLK